VGIGAIAIGKDARIRDRSGNQGALGTGTIVIGDSAVGYSNNSVVIGDHAESAHSNNVSVGSGAKGGLSGSVTVGVGAQGLGYCAVSVGGGSLAERDGSISVGYGAQSLAIGAVAIGQASVADVANSVSVGSKGKERKIVNVADASLSETSTEATTGRQLFVTNQNVTSNTQAIGSNTNRITQLEGRTDVLEHEAVRYDTEQHDVVTFNAAGAETRLSHVAPAVEPNDAVTKVQLDNLDQKLRYFRARGEDGSDTEAAAGADGSIAVGSNARAHMPYSIAMGQGSLSNDHYVMALGANAVADNNAYGG
jgi:autotransporter adhesin